MDLTTILNHWGFALVFGAVLLEQAGLPLPSAPLLVAAGALSVEGSLRADLALLTAFSAAFIADHGWFYVGRRYGRRLLDRVCRVSLSPDICVSRTDELIAKHGPALLLFAKFIPGVSAVSIPTAAAMGISYRRFAQYDALGVALWSGLYIGAGAVFSHEIGQLLRGMDWIGPRAGAVIVLAFAAYLGAKLLHRRALQRLHRLVRISPLEVGALLDDDHDLVIVDTRSRVARTSDPRQLPRSIVLDDLRAVDTLPPDLRERKTVVTFCTCPNEASAAFVAELLIKAGYRNVRVLTGGSGALDVLAELPALAA